MADISIGDKAPDFSLPITLQEKMTLSDVLKEKKVVLAPETGKGCELQSGLGSEPALLRSGG
jgi:peroxiredoxin